MDNGTMVEAFKYLNYCQLAKNSLVSKRFRDLIQTHRHSLALLYVDEISMYSAQSGPDAINVFGKELSPEAYNEWVIRNSYSKQIPIESQVASEESTQSITNGYGLAAYACYKDLSYREWNDRTTVFSAGVNSTTRIGLYSNISFVSPPIRSFTLTKFMNLKNSGESQLVEVIEGNFNHQTIEFLNRIYAKFIAKEDKDDSRIKHIFEFVNVDIEKKLQLTIENRGWFWSDFSIKITDMQWVNFL
ncbi:hypothetical protein Ddc_23246 [Ditylenchus destructor]|nr:hypothetical protein Ddc_23246 [Ditylenchus destructor]